MKFPNEVDAEFVEVKPKAQRKLPAPREAQLVPVELADAAVSESRPSVPEIDLQQVIGAVQRFHKNPVAFILTIAAKEAVKRIPAAAAQVSKTSKLKSRRKR